MKELFLLFAMCAIMGCTEAPTRGDQNGQDTPDQDALVDAQDNDARSGPSPVHHTSGGCDTDFNCENYNICMNHLCVEVGDPSSSQSDQCLEVESHCQIYASGYNGWYVYRGKFCYDPGALVELNVMTGKVEMHVPIWALSSEPDEMGNLCSSDHDSGVVVDNSCFTKKTPAQLGFKVHCTSQNEGFPRTLLWRLGNSP